MGETPDGYSHVLFMECDRRQDEHALVGPGKPWRVHDRALDEEGGEEQQDGFYTQVVGETPEGCSHGLFMECDRRQIGSGHV